VREIAGAMGFAHLGLFIRSEFSEVYLLRSQLGWGRDDYTRRPWAPMARLAGVLRSIRFPDF